MEPGAQVDASGRIVVPLAPRTEGQPGGDPWGGFSSAPPAAPAASADPWQGSPKKRPKVEEKPKREVGTAEAALSGITNAASFGAGPALEGLSAAAQPDLT